MIAVEGSPRLQNCLSLHRVSLAAKVTADFKLRGKSSVFGGCDGRNVSETATLMSFFWKGRVEEEELKVEIWKCTTLPFLCYLNNLFLELL